MYPSKSQGQLYLPHHAQLLLKSQIPTSAPSSPHAHPFPHLEMLPEQGCGWGWVDCLLPSRVSYRSGTCQAELRAAGAPCSWGLASCRLSPGSARPGAHQPTGSRARRGRAFSEVNSLMLRVCAPICLVLEKAFLQELGYWKMIQIVALLSNQQCGLSLAALSQGCAPRSPFQAFLSSCGSACQDPGL